MPNTNVYTGLDGTISVAGDMGVEGELAGEIANDFELIPVGRATNVTVQVDSALRPFHEIGQRYATELRAGNVDVSGTIGRAYINSALLRLMLGEGASGARPAGAFATPTFNLSLLHENPATPGVTSKVSVYGVRISSWVYEMPEDDFVMESVAFKALWVGSAEEG